MALTRISTNVIKDNAVSATKIADNSVSGSKLIDNSVNGSKILDNALSFSKLGSGAICNVWFTSDATHYYTNNQSGFTWLELTFTPAYQNSRFLIMCTIAGSANDDAHGYLERYTNGGWSRPDSFVGTNSYPGSWGDWSITRATEDKQILQYTAVYIDQPNTGGTVGYRARNTAENTNGFYSNRSMGWDGGYNSNTSRSTMMIMEIKA